MSRARIRSPEHGRRPATSTQDQRRLTRIQSLQELRRYPWLHLTLHGIWDAIYVKRGEGDTEALDQALAVLHAGGAIGLSPEGVRTGGGLQRGLHGVAHLAFASRAPIVPIAVFGQERIRERIRGLRRSQVHVRIGPALHAPAGEPTAQTLQALTERVMLEIARRLPAEYRGVYAASVEAEAR